MGDNTDLPFGNDLVKPKLKQPAVLQIFLGKIPYNTTDPQTSQCKLNDHIAGCQLKLRHQGHFILGQKLIHVASGAGLSFQGNDRQLFQFLQIQHFILILDKFSACYKYILYGAHLYRL